jgi:hypothetical protein
VAFVVAVEVKVRAPGKRIFQVGRHGSLQKGNKRKRVPLIFGNIMISSQVKFQANILWDVFWGLQVNFLLDGGSTTVLWVLK